jgi:phytoene dehydrogenase-like protein
MAGQSLIAVVGTGLAGLAAATRLAHGGHQVVVLDAEPAPVPRDPATEAGGTVFTGLTSWRELFGDTGTNLADLLAAHGLHLQPAPPRQIRGAHTDLLDLPAEAAAQVDAIRADLGEEAANAWRELLDDLDQVRAAVEYLGQTHPFNRPRLSGTEQRILQVRHSIAELAAALPIPELGEVVLNLAAWLGQDPRQLPAWHAYRLAVEAHEGRWQLAARDGSIRPASDLLRLLESRMTEQGVAIHSAVEVLDIRRGPRLRTTEGTLQPAAVISTLNPFAHADLTRERPDQRLARPLRRSPAGGPLWRGWRTLLELPALEPSLPRVIVASAWSPGGPDSWAQLRTGKLAADHLSDLSPER